MAARTAQRSRTHADMSLTGSTIIAAAPAGVLSSRNAPANDAIGMPNTTSRSSIIGKYDATPSSVAKFKFETYRFGRSRKQNLAITIR